MVNARCFFYFIFILFSTYDLHAHAVLREKLIEDAKNILNTKPNEYNGKKELYEKLSLLKSQVQFDLKGGLQTAGVDIYLLLDGLIDDNSKSLQSYLAFSTQDDLAKYFGASITYSYAQKLASALKENRSALQTQFNVQTNKDKGQCTLIINGKEQEFKSIFYAPAGTPFYIGSYCKDGTFAVREVISEPYQKQYKIHFENYERIHSQEALLAMGVPNPHSAEYETCPNCQKSQNFESHTADSSTRFAVATGVGIDAFTQTLEDENISNAGLPYGFLLYSSSTFQLQTYSFTLDLAQINRDYVIQNQTAGHLEEITETQKGLFLRPKIGLKDELMLYPGLSFSGGLNAGLIYVASSGENPLEKTGGLAEITLGSKIKNEAGLYAHLDGHGGINFGEISGFFVGAALGAGVEF